MKHIDNYIDYTLINTLIIIRFYGLVSLGPILKP